MNPVLTPDQVAEHFQVTRDLVIRKAMSEEWPCLRIGKRTIRFTEEHLVEIQGIAEITPAGNVYSMTGHKRRSGRG
jgi:hypothetical protein